MIIVIAVLGGLAGISGVIAGTLCCWKCQKRKRDQMVPRKHDLGLHSFLMFCVLTFSKIGLDLPRTAPPYLTLP